MKNDARPLALALALVLPACSCDDDPLGLIQGSLEVEVRNLRAEAETWGVHVEPDGEGALDAEQDAERPTAKVRFEAVPVGLASVVVTAYGELEPLDQVTAYPVAIVRNELTTVIIDFATSSVSVTPPVADTPDVCLDEQGEPDAERDVLCGQCDESDGSIGAIDDDEDCGVIACDGLDGHRLQGENTAAGSSSCILDSYDDVTADRCLDVAVCKPANDPATCGDPTSGTVLEAALCETIAGCAGDGPPSLVVAPDGTPCGTDLVCDGGECVAVTDPPPPPPPDPEVGCADGTREGFLDLPTYPSIAACAGGFSSPGVTLASPAPACARAGGDDGANAEGTGCAAEDLCDDGWHVCLGKSEVLDNAPAGCAAAVPAGTPDKALFFAVAQHSDNGSVCNDAATGENDVFGCGNLGTVLTPDKGCGPLTRVLASTAPNSCGFNEAEPPLGPWRCEGGSDSHLHEGALVTKTGCPGTSCSYDGNPIGNMDKGGVLCCRD